MAPEGTVLSWTSPTHLKAERSTDWYWALGLLAICGVIASVLWGNLLFAAIIALGAFMIGVMAAREPRECEIHLSAEGIVVDHDFYSFSSLRAFWIETHHEYPKLYLATTGLIHPHIVIILRPPAGTDNVHEILSRFVPEETRHSLGTIVAEFLGL
ncbi:MAG: hypothetical protein KGJ34_01380 [Patescibacteria group bacterium]|nr:hypothetical protein [Patescibacteria group bacterium]